jgi:hypothetical protein
MFGPPKRSPTKTDRDVEPLWSQTRGGMRAGGRTQRRKNLSSLRQRLDSIEDASRGDTRLNALLRRLELAEEHSEMNGRRPEDQTRPFGGRVRSGSRSSSDEDRESTELTSDESDSSSPTHSPPRRRTTSAGKAPGQEKAADLLSASRARGMEASLRRLRAELDQERKTGERMRAELSELRSAQRKVSARGGAAQLASVRESEGMKRVQNELDDVRRALVAERKKNAAPKVNSGATAVGVRVRRELDAERKARLTAERALRETRAECARAWEQVKSAEEDAARAAETSRKRGEEKSSLERELEIAYERCSRAESLGRDLRREGAALASDAEVVSRANEALDERCTTLNARMEAMERELEELRPLEREVASLREWKKSQANDLKEAMEVLGHV